MGVGRWILPPKLSTRPAPREGSPGAPLGILPRALWRSPSFCYMLSRIVQTSFKQDRKMFSRPLDSILQLQPTRLPTLKDRLQRCRCCPSLCLSGSSHSDGSTASSVFSKDRQPREFRLPSSRATPQACLPTTTAKQQGWTNYHGRREKAQVVQMIPFSSECKSTGCCRQERRSVARRRQRCNWKSSQQVLQPYRRLSARFRFLSI